jgi:hypothetical protein
MNGSQIKQMKTNLKNLLIIPTQVILVFIPK